MLVERLRVSAQSKLIKISLAASAKQSATTQPHKINSLTLSHYYN